MNTQQPASDGVAQLFERRGEHYLLFLPHGYEAPIALPVITSGSREQAQAWTWNGCLEKPTLKPSVKTTHADGKVSHLWLTDGLCKYLSDSTDGLAGQTLPLRRLSTVGAGSLRNQARKTKMELQPHQQRVVDEKTELDDKRTKLKAFIDGSAIFVALPSTKKNGLSVSIRA